MASCDNGLQVSDAAAWEVALGDTERWSIEASDHVVQVAVSDAARWQVVAAEAPCC